MFILGPCTNHPKKSSQHTAEILKFKNFRINTYFIWYSCVAIILSWIIVSLYLGSEEYILKYSCMIQKTNFGETGLYKEDTVRGYMDIRYLFLHVTSYLCIITSNTSFHRDGRVCDLPTPWRHLSFFLVTGTLLLLRCASVTCSGRWSRTTEHVFHITIPLHNAKHRVSPPHRPFTVGL